MDVVSSIRREGNLVEILFNDSRKLCLSSKIFRAHRVSEGDPWICTAICRRLPMRSARRRCKRQSL